MYKTMTSPVEPLETRAMLSASPVQLAGTVVGTSGSYRNLGNVIAKAVDGKLSSYFDAPVANGNWIGLDLGVPEVLTQIRYASRSGYASRMNGGIFQASDSADFSAGVVNLYTIPAGANPGSGVLSINPTANTAAFRYVRYLAPPGAPRSARWQFGPLRLF